LNSESLLLSSVVIGFSLIVAAVAFGSAVGDGIVSSKAVEAIARQPEARPNIFTFMFLGVGVLEAFPIIGLGLGLYLFFVVSNAPAGIPVVLKALSGGH